MIHSASSFDQLADGRPKPYGQCFAKNKTVLVITVVVPLGVSSSAGLLRNHQIEQTREDDRIS